MDDDVNRSLMLSATIVSTWLDCCWARATLEIPGLDLRAVLGEQWQRPGCGAPSCVLLRSSESRHGCGERHRCWCYRYTGGAALHVVEGMESSQERRVLVKVLLGAGVDMDLFNRNLETALHLAVLQGGKNLVRLLVKCGRTGVGRIHHWVSRCVWLWVGDMAAVTRMLLQDVRDAEMTYKNISDASCSRETMAFGGEAAR